jgi:tyrosinase
LDGICNDAASYCGIRDRKYPDKKAMGYPFDRLARDGKDRLEMFLTSNMFVQDCTIIHENNQMPRTRKRSN